MQHPHNFTVPYLLIPLLWTASLPACYKFFMLDANGGQERGKHHPCDRALAFDLENWERAPTSRSTSTSQAKS
ncbi:hypothetical protein [Cryobacterium sp. Y50]|uniref:hypothetical protein n=1 Tax=Cryobacterium sp. Y50 TaxID=2048286 RepID=UPI0011B0BEF6|nr:hypothetical protein [Cryobacterium sp. Y50]